MKIRLGLLLWMVAALVLAFSPVSAQHAQWLDRIAAYEPGSPEAARRARLAEALRAINSASVKGNFEKIMAVIKDGWSGRQIEVSYSLMSNALALDALSNIAMGGRLELPPMDDPSRPVFDFQQMLGTGCLLTCRSYEHLAKGRPDEAAAQAVASALFANLFYHDGSTVFEAILGLQLMPFALHALDEVVEKGTASPDTLKKAGAELYKIDQAFPSALDLVAAESRRMIAFQRSVRDNPARQAAAGSPEELAEMLGTPDAFEEWLNQTLPHFEQPFAERRWQPAPISVEKPKGVPRFQEIEMRSMLVQTYLRIAIARLAAATGNEAYAAKVIDPFSGEPLRRAGAMFYSVGPDGKDQGGKVSYEHSPEVFDAELPAGVLAQKRAGDVLLR